MLNPLRYPGGKRVLVNYINDLIIANNLIGCTFVEPYAGSAVVGLELLRFGNIDRLVINEKDLLIYSFWKCVFLYTDELCDRIERTPVSIPTWKRLSHLRKIENLDGSSVIDLGFAGLFFNRTNFSGILKANPIGGLEQTSKYGIDCRFNKSEIIKCIYRLSELRTSVEVHFGDALDFMRNHQDDFQANNSFIYFDPPYFLKGSQLYRHSYLNSDHIALANFVSMIRGLDWLVSYDDVPYIATLYGNMGAQYRPIYLDYSCATRVRAKGQELLISNLPLPPLVQEFAI